MSSVGQIWYTVTVKKGDLWLAFLNKSEIIETDDYIALQQSTPSIVEAKSFSELMIEMGNEKFIDLLNKNPSSETQEEWKNIIGPKK